VFPLLYLKTFICIDTVDTIYADVAQPDQAHILALNAQHFMKNGGKFVITIKVKKEKF
jgi:rRNA 2'-O-methyltransferase fibrillarin